jgi:hypothetical protein
MPWQCLSGVLAANPGGRDVSPLNISRLLCFDTESWLFHVSYFWAT